MKKILCIILLSVPSFAAIPANLVLEVRPTTGNDTNGGGFIAGATGSDMSQFPSPNSGGCSAGTTCFSSTANLSSVLAQTTNTTTLTCAACSFTSAITGNTIYLTLGGGSCVSGTVNTQWRSVTFASSTTITLDVTPTGGGTTCTGLTMNVGGALATLTNATTVLGFATAPFFTFVKAESGITQTATATFPTGGTPSNTAPFSRLEGYTSTRGDGGHATITMSTNTGLTALMMGNGWRVNHLTIDCASLGTCSGLSLATYGQLWDVKISNCTTAGLTETGAGNNEIHQLEVTGCGSGSTPVNLPFTSLIEFSYIHDNSATGITTSSSGGATIRSNIIARNTGSTSIHGISTTYIGGAFNITDNALDSNGGDGIKITGTSATIGMMVKGNIMYNNGLYGMEANSAIFGAAYAYDGNAYGANGTAARHNLDDTSTNKLDGVAPYTNTMDVTLSANPWVSNSGGNYTLNATAGGGAAIAAAGFPGTFGIGTTSTVGYLAIGPVQPQGGSNAVSVGYAQ